jgi:hypothetical protein
MWCGVLDMIDVPQNLSDEWMEFAQSRFRLGRMVKGNVTTEIYIEFCGASGLNQKSTKRRLVAISDDGRPNRVIPVPGNWSDQELSDLVKSTIEPSLIPEMVIGDFCDLEPIQNNSVNSLETMHGLENI